jgi:hypothetical protein
MRKTLRRCRSGKIIVEFAMVAPMLAMLVLGLIEAGIQLGTGLLLESAARDASRFGVTGATAPAGMANPPSDRSQSIRRIVVERGAGMLRDDRLAMTITSFGRFEDLGTPAAGTAGPGGRGEVVVYQFAYTQPVLTPLPAAAFGRSEFVHSSTAIVRNEPFPAQ